MLTSISGKHSYPLLLHALCPMTFVWSETSAVSSNPPTAVWSVVFQPPFDSPLQAIIKPASHSPSASLINYCRVRFDETLNVPFSRNTGQVKHKASSYQEYVQPSTPTGTILLFAVRLSPKIAVTIFTSLS